MDVELQILKHLPRDAQSTVSVIDDYCTIYKDLFKEVRNYECFKYLHLGIISPIITKIITRNIQGSRNQLSSIITSFHRVLMQSLMGETPETALHR